MEKKLLNSNLITIVLLIILFISVYRYNFGNSLLERNVAFYTFLISWIGVTGLIIYNIKLITKKHD